MARDHRVPRRRFAGDAGGYSGCMTSRPRARERRADPFDFGYACLFSGRLRPPGRLPAGFDARAALLQGMATMDVAARTAYEAARAEVTGAGPSPTEAAS